MKELLLGVHLSVSGGVDSVFDEAERLKINCFQIFLGSPRVWKVIEPEEDKIKKFKERVKAYEFCNVHAPYLLNFATLNPELFDKSVNRAVLDMKIMSKLGINFYVIHPGSSNNVNGISRIKEAIKLVIDKVKDGMILIENLSGEKNDWGKNIDEIVAIIDDFGDRIGVCLDTCHLFASGVDIRDKKELEKFYLLLEKNNLLSKIKLIHANDSKKPLASKIDRHEHIGDGEIGRIGFFNLLHHPFFGSLPYILETPKDENADEKNLQVLKKLFSAENI